jgi:hypothetical protein
MGSIKAHHSNTKRTRRTIVEQLRSSRNWIGEQPEAFNPFQVWPTPVGIHVFAGHEAQYTAEYCKKFPDSPYCVIPEPNETL